MTQTIAFPDACEIRSVIRFLSAQKVRPFKLYRHLKGVWCCECEMFKVEEETCMATIERDFLAHHRRLEVRKRMTKLYIRLTSNY